MGIVVGIICAFLFFIAIGCLVSHYNDKEEKQQEINMQKKADSEVLSEEEIKENIYRKISEN